MDTQSFYYPMKHLLLLVIGSVLMAGISLWLVFEGINGETVLIFPPTFLIIVGAIGALFFGFALFFWGYRLIVPQPALEITSRGIIDNSSALATKIEIPYENIEKAYLSTFANQMYIVVDVYDESPILEQASTLRRKSMLLNKKQLGLSIVLITLKGHTNEELEEIARLINERKENSTAEVSI